MGECHVIKFPDFSGPSSSYVGCMKTLRRLSVVSMLAAEQSPRRGVLRRAKTDLLSIVQVIRIIKLCKPKDSMDYDDISMRVLSRIAPQVVKPLVHIFNISFSTGKFPSEMKMAKVMQLFKNGNKSDYSNYRPI